MHCHSALRSGSVHNFLPAVHFAAAKVHFFTPQNFVMHCPISFISFFLLFFIYIKKSKVHKKKENRKKKGGCVFCGVGRVIGI